MATAIMKEMTEAGERPPDVIHTAVMCRTITLLLHKTVDNVLSPFTEELVVKHITL